MPYPWKQEQVDALLKGIADGDGYAAIAEELNTRFKTKFTPAAVKHKLNRIKGLPTSRRNTRWTPEMIDTLLQAKATDMSFQGIADMINEQFNTHVTVIAAQSKWYEQRNIFQPTHAHELGEQQPVNEYGSPIEPGDLGDIGALEENLGEVDPFGIDPEGVDYVAAMDVAAMDLGKVDLPPMVDQREEVDLATPMDLGEVELPPMEDPDLYDAMML
jgi:hypothetical protein